MMNFTVSCLEDGESFTLLLLPPFSFSLQNFALRIMFESGSHPWRINVSFNGPSFLLPSFFWLKNTTFNNARNRKKQEEPFSFHPPFFLPPPPP